ncbi:Protein PLASTID MOVEMENT IMPAIRED 15 [Hirschfeldia incana]|nr:Protein PLASTID MOVEMENT IMPAIRED 15 [Hirschfeldia incana]
MANSNVWTETAETSMYRQNAITDSIGLPIVKSYSSLVEDLHKSKKKLDGYTESKRESESSRARAEVELFKAMELVKELTLLIERSNRNKKFHRKDVEASKIDIIKVEENGEYVEVMRDLEAAKEEVSRLKLDLDSVLGEKVAAEKEVVKIGFKMEEKLRVLESLKKEIEVASEEHFLVELGKMDASTECEEIERMREGEGEEVLDFLVEKNKKIKKMLEEADRSKGIDVELFETTSDVEMLQTQLNLVKKMERGVHRRDKSMSRSFERGKCTITVLKEVTEETEAKKEALASLNAELFKLMMVMDELRKQINQAKEETGQLNRILRKNDDKIQKLNAKMIMAKSKLEIALSAKERVTSLADSLAGSLEKIKKNKEAAKEEECLLIAQKTVKEMETQKTKLEIEEKERELSSHLDELEKAKQAEGLVLEKLESLIGDKMERRETEFENCSTITITRFEYEYLSRHGSLAEETAEKKVAAAEAWAEALRASTRAVLMKTGSLMGESGMMRVEEEREVSRTERSFSTKRLAEDEAESYISPKPVRKSTLAQRGKSRRYSSAGTPTVFVIKKKKVLKLVKLFSRKR